MRIENAYKIERIVSKLNSHILDMCVWYLLRYYLNRRLPRYYSKHPYKEGASYAKYTDKDIVISLTTYPKRMHTLPLVLESLMRQTIKPTKIELWLAEEQYTEKENVYKQLGSFVKRGLEIHFCEDLKSHKKYYYAMKNNPEALVVTADDDVIYSETMLEDLLITYVNHQNCIIAHRAHTMMFDNGNVLPYNKWNYRALGCVGPDLYLCATGCAGCLYPPHLLPEIVFDKDIFKDKCFEADDIWLKCMEYINRIPVVLTGMNNPEIITVIGTSDNGLAKSNVEEGKNDQQLKAVTEYYGIIWK